MNVQADFEFGLRFLNDLRLKTADEPGVTRVAYGQGENAAHNLLAAMAKTLDLEAVLDFAGNTYVTVPGREPAAPRILIGSHLDSVPHGGNFDGAAGVAAGLAVLAGLRRAGHSPPLPVTVMGIRAEESCWFPASYIGSRMALGRLRPQEVDGLRRSDSGRSLGEHLDDLGLDSNAVREGKTGIRREDVAWYVEPHIEQGPVLDKNGFPLAIVEAITGGSRYREARIYGEYAHAGAAPRGYRRDAVAALGDFISDLNKLWAKLEGDGKYSLFTFGIVATDVTRHTFSRVPGEVHFCLDTRGIREDVLTDIRRGLAETIATIEAKHGVKFDLGADSGPSIATMDPSLRRHLIDAAKNSGLQPHVMPSGAGHDAAAFAAAGIPSGMLFIRNQNGSHNPLEDMQPQDFESACNVLMNFVLAATPKSKGQS